MDDESFAGLTLTELLLAMDQTYESSKGCIEKSKKMLQEIEKEVEMTNQTKESLLMDSELSGLRKQNQDLMRRCQTQEQDIETLHQRVLDSAGSSMQAVLKSQQFLVTKKNKQIDELRKQLKAAGDVKETTRSPQEVMETEVARKSEVTPQKGQIESKQQENIEKTISALKRKYFYALILSLKLSMMHNGGANTLDANSLWTRAQDVPFEQWDLWIYEQMNPGPS